MSSGCKKDEQVQPESPGILAPKPSVDIQESQSYFQKKNYPTQSNFTVNQTDWASLVPAWDAARQVELNDSSRVVMVPIADSAIMVNPYLDAYIVFFKDSLFAVQMHILFFQADTTQYQTDSFPTIANFSGLIWEFYDEEDTYFVSVVKDGIISGCGCSSLFGEFINNLDPSAIIVRSKVPKCPRWKDNIWDKIGSASGDLWNAISGFFNQFRSNGSPGTISGPGTTSGGSSGGNGTDSFGSFGFGGNIGHGGGGGGSSVILNLSSIFSEWQIKLIHKAAIWMNSTYGTDLSTIELFSTMDLPCIWNISDFLLNPSGPAIDEDESGGPECAHAYAVQMILEMFPQLTEDDEVEIEFLLYNHADREKLASYTQGDESRTENMKGYIALKSDDSAYQVDRFIELSNLLEDDPNALLIDCISENEEFDISFWGELATFTPSASVKSKIVSDGYSLQLIENAESARVNLDFYFIQIYEMPKNSNGQRMTNEELISYFRIHINQFSDFDPILGSTFDPIPSDQTIWVSNNPLGAIVKIDIPGDNGVVACTDFSSCCWIFSTVKDHFIGSGYHPVSGNRQFGIAENGGNKYFYLKGADRASTYWDNLISPLVYGGTDQLWDNVITRFNNFITNPIQDGSTMVGSPTRHRPNWNAIKNQLKLPQTINHINCE